MVMQRKREKHTLESWTIYSEHHHPVLGTENENYAGIGEGGIFITIGQSFDQPPVTHCQ